MEWIVVYELFHGVNADAHAAGIRFSGFSEHDQKILK
jgi:hypothetical protein